MAQLKAAVACVVGVHADDIELKMRSDDEKPTSTVITCDESYVSRDLLSVAANCVLRVEFSAG